MRIPAILALLVLIPPAQAREPAPAPDCADARAIERIRRVDAGTLLMSTRTARFLVRHVAGCDVRQPSSLIGAHGWICPDAESYLRTGDLACPIQSIETIDDRRHAALAAEADRNSATRNADGSVTLETVQVTARKERPRGFRGDTDYCLRPDAVRSFHLTHDALYVDTSPRRSGGNRRYRIELTTSCPQLTWARSIAFESSLGIGVICGNAGDNLLPIEQENVPDREMTRPSNPRMIGRQCGISSVYPVR